MKHVLLFSFLLSFAVTLYAAVLFGRSARRISATGYSSFGAMFMSLAAGMLVLFIAEYIVLNVVHDDTFLYAFLEAAAYCLATISVIFYTRAVFPAGREGRRSTIIYILAVLGVSIILSRFSNHILGYHSVVFYRIKRISLALLGLIVIYTSLRLLAEKKKNSLRRIIAWIGIVVPLTFVLDIYLLRFKFYDGPVRLGMSYPLTLTIYLVCCCRLIMILSGRIRTLKNPSSTINTLSGLYGITKREKEIITLIAEGKSNGDIAESLFISLTTVKNHVHSIFSKMGISSRFELIHAIFTDTEKQI